uniref:DUF3592 domain-containing protein n=1 Tax=Solibacter usitatus (strain Ellin6076) TaxID=234267 RepID=Q01SK5_SOLUE
MLRALIVLVLIAGAVLFTLPFLVSSLYVDQRGITIPGKVHSKREDVTVHNSTWQRSCEMTVEYSPPDTSSVAFLAVQLPPDRYDEFRKGLAVTLHYLPRKDVPHLPLAHILSEVHALTTARIAGQTAFSNWEDFFTRDTLVVCALLCAAVVVLLVWRLSRLPGFAWAVCGCVIVGLVAMAISDFPTTVPGPLVDVRSGSGKVKSVDRIDRLFQGKRSRGFDADQPVAVVGVEFLPAGRTEPVLGVDLIDAGSIAGLKPGATVAVDYEAASPRTAHIRNATRSFPWRNVRGIAVESVLSLLLLVGAFAAWEYLGRAWSRKMGSRA